MSHSLQLHLKLKMDEISLFSIYHLSVDNDSTVGMQTLSRDKATILACKEDETCCDLAGLSWATHRCAAELLLSGGSHSCRNKRSPDYIKLVEAEKFLQEG
jgi:hypothetical protein